MKQIRKSILYLLLIITASAMVACNAGGNKIASGGKLSVDEFSKLLTTTPDAQLIDVRTAEEFSTGHLRNAKLISINNSDFERQVATLDKSKPVFVYCLSGGRSSSAANTMRSMGFSKVYEMPGIMAWTAAGMEVVTEDNAIQPSSNALTLETYAQLVNEKGYVLVDFSATWCKPCKIIAPILDKLANEYSGKMNLRKLDADEQSELCKAKGIDGIPYLELFKDGKLVWSHKGLVEESELRNQLK